MTFLLSRSFLSLTLRASSCSISMAMMTANSRLRGVVFDMDGTLKVPVIDFGAMYRAVLGEDEYKRIRAESPTGIDILHHIESWSPDKQQKAYEIIADYEKQGVDKLQIMPAMDSGDAACSLVLCGKSSLENDVAMRLKNSHLLKIPDNTQLSLLLQSEATHLTQDCFDPSFFLNSISTLRFGRFLIWSPRLSSTHDLVSHNFSRLPLGSVCVSDMQFKGRGRTTNVWESPRGCLMYSFTLEMEDGRVVPLLQYVVSLALTEALKDLCHTKGLPYIDVKIKWPNDLYLNGLKVGGILCTSTYRSKKFHVTVGVGLNVDNQQPTTCLNALLKHMSPASDLLKREEILAAFFHKFERFFDLFVDQGFKSLEELYYRTWLHSEQRVIVEEKIGDQVIQNVVTIQGLTSSGYLLATGDDNQMYELHPDGNSLDFFKGLIRRKL